MARSKPWMTAEELGYEDGRDKLKRLYEEEERMQEAARTPSKDPIDMERLPLYNPNSQTQEYAYPIDDEHAPGGVHFSYPTDDSSSSRYETGPDGDSGPDGGLD